MANGAHALTARETEVLALVRVESTLVEYGIRARRGTARPT